MPGAYFKMSDPALEFVKMFCHVLALESSVESEVARLKMVPHTTQSFVLCSFLLTCCSLLWLLLLLVACASVGHA